MRWYSCIPVFLTIALQLLCHGAEADLQEEARAGLRKAVGFFREKVSLHGGYLWRYSADLKKKEGEGKVGDTTAWVQPPGTPFVGEALLEAHACTGEEYYLEAARETAGALVKAQLHSGGWDYRIEYDPADRKKYAYRVDGPAGKKARDISVLDDNTTQAALAFLICFDRATGFKEQTVHEAVTYALESLLKAQFPNGAWSQVYRGPVDDPAKYPVKAAGYRKDDEHTHVKAYWELYTLNDNLLRDAVETLFLAAEVYGEKRFSDAALKAGDFLVLAQMPDPQPGWAQQYDYEMHPCWARKFEPPAITGGESQGAMLLLLDLYERTGKRAYLDAVGKALPYYRRSLLPDGRLARFYELKTNKPLYFTREYELTFSDADMPTHYSFKVSSGLSKIEKRHKELGAKPWQPPGKAGPSRARPSASAVRVVLGAMDERGAWVEEGALRYWGGSDPTRKIIDPRTFVENVRMLAAYVAR